MARVMAIATTTAARRQYHEMVTSEPAQRVTGTDMIKNVCLLITAGLSVWMTVIVIDMRRTDFHEMHRPVVVMLPRK